LTSLDTETYGMHFDPDLDRRGQLIKDSAAMGTLSTKTIKFIKISIENRWKFILSQF